MICKHCNKAITCGCQKATAVDGSTVHKSCLHDYTVKINSAKNSTLIDKANTAYTKLMNK
ncbi:MAG: hypothetical protein E6R13_08695 [Spirochaetes bacterium]|nr:MAG: hypothetical protein E6R13_08695 [Spirochaetota bacterium]